MDGSCAPPPYPNPGYPGPPQPSWQQQPPPQQQPQTVVIHQVAAPAPQIVMPFGDCPVRSTCPACSQSVVTNVDHEIGSHAICMCVLLFCVGCDMGCCFIPFCMDSCKDVVHTCPACGIQIAKYDR